MTTMLERAARAARGPVSAMNDEDYIASRSEPDLNSGCWIWSLAHFNNGYGAVSNRGERLAHRMSYRAFVGPIPDGAFVCHKCDTPSCVNPSHLFTGSQSENMRDMVRKGRHGLSNNPHKSALCGNRIQRLSGSKAPRAALSGAQVKSIRSRASSGEGLAEMAMEYGVSRETIRRVVLGITYVNEPQP